MQGLPNLTELRMRIEDTRGMFDEVKRHLRHSFPPAGSTTQLTSLQLDLKNVDGRCAPSLLDPGQSTSRL
jgi:hypothetical protein